MLLISFLYKFNLYILYIYLKKIYFFFYLKYIFIIYVF